MTDGVLAYSVITPVRDEADNLPRLARCLGVQTARPREWIIVDNGSVDDTLAVAQELERRESWIRALSIPGEPRAVRGRPIVRSLHAGLGLLDPAPDIVISVDADVSFDELYFQKLLAEFVRDSRLGIASGNGYEQGNDGRWVARHVTGSTVWGATRAYRWECLQDVIPLEERLGWDGIDEFKANARGWHTHSFLELPFFHHRSEGAREGQWRMRVEQGRMSHYVGYRPSYLVLRALFNAVRHPSGLGLIPGYVGAALRRTPQLADEGARSYVRGQQRLRNVPLRLREAAGRVSAGPPERR